MSNKAARGLGPVPDGLGDGLSDFLGQVRRIMLDVQAGRVATLQVSGSGSGSGVSSGGSSSGSGGATYEPDLTPPPTPAVFNAVAGMDFAGITTEAPTFSQGHGYLATIVYGAKYAGSGPEPTFANATQVHSFIGEVGSFPTDPSTTWHLWVKWKSRDGVLSVSPAGGANGVKVTTGQDVSRLMTALAGKVKNEQLDPASNFIFRANLFTIAPATGGLPNVLPFSVLATPTMTAAGELLPAGTYIDAAYVRNLEAALGRFQQAFITNAMIVSVSASRITSGVISVGNYIQSSTYVSGSSGWRIHGDGSAEFSAASIRGKLTANQIDGEGLTITKNGVVILGAGNSLNPAYLPDEGRNNLIDLSWWRRLGPIPWVKNGAGEENTLYTTSDVGGLGPRGTSDIVMYAREAVGDGYAGGGWDAPNTLTLDPSKTYRFVLPIKKRDGAGGTAYWGVQPNTVCDINTASAAGNPYFAYEARDALANDRWYLFVGFVFPQGSTGNTHDGAGIYDCRTGLMVRGGYNFCHAPGGAKGHRAYQYYAGAGSTQLFGRPMLNLVDGTEPPLREYFEPGALLNDALTPSINAAASTAIWGGVSGRPTDLSGLDSSRAGKIDGVQAGATVGATIGSNLSGAFSQYSWDVVMNGQALIRSAHIQQLTAANLSVTTLSNVVNGSVSSGARVQIDTNSVSIYSASNALRVRLSA